MTAEERDDHQRQRSWATVTGIGPKTALVITQAMAGEVPEYLQQLRDEKEPLVEGGDAMRAAIKGDLHCHSTWSDGGSPLEEMMITARALGHEYCAITDHSPRLTVARGLTAERLREQQDVITDLNAALDEPRRPSGCCKGSRSTSSRTAVLIKTTTCWPSWTSWWPACTPSCARIRRP